MDKVAVIGLRTGADRVMGARRNPNRPEAVDYIY